MTRKLTAVALAWLLLATALIGTAPAAAAAAGNSTTAINSCGVIDQPGRYAITSDLVAGAGNAGVCLNVRASNVTIAGGGHTVSPGPTDDDTAIAIQPSLANVTVRNLTVTGFTVGVTPVDNSVIEDMTFRSMAGTGVDISSAADNVTVRDSRFVNVERPIAIDQSTGTTIRNVSVEGGDIGINLYGTDSNPATTTVENVTLRNASRYGLSIRGNVNGSAIANVTLSGASAWDLRVPTDLGTATIHDLYLPDMHVERASGAYFQFRAIRDAPADPPGARNVSIYANVSSANPNAVVDLSVSYDDTQVDESNLTIWRYHAGDWVNETPNASIDTAANRIGLEMRQFSVLAPMELTADAAGGEDGATPGVPDVDPPSPTPEDTPTATQTPASTPTDTATPGVTPTATRTVTATDSPTPTDTASPTVATTMDTPTPKADGSVPLVPVAIIGAALVLAALLLLRRVL